MIFNRKVFSKVIMLILISISITFSQSISQGEKDQILSDLLSEDFITRGQALWNVDKHNITEALSILEDRIWTEEKCELKDNILRLLDKFNSSNIYSISLAIIDSADQCADDIYNTPLSIKVEAVKILYKYNNYDYTYLIFDLLRKDINENISMFLLPQVIENVPAYSDSAKYYLFKIAQDSSVTNSSRYYAINKIYEIYGDEVIPISIQTVKTDKYSSNRIASFFKLCELEYTGLEGLIKERIYEEGASSYRLIYIDSLLTRFGTPENYKYIIDYIENETNEINLNLITEISLKKFKPKKPFDEILLSTGVENLIDYTNSSYNYGWLQDSTFKSELDSNLVNAKTFLENGDSTNCYKQVKLFNQKIDSVYSDSAGSAPKYVSEEGYKFLYNYSNYILERLPEPPNELTNADIIILLNNFKTSTEECLTNGWLSGAWVRDALVASINSGISAMEQNLPQSCVTIMVQFNSTLESYKTSNYLTDDAYNLLKPKSNDISTKLDELLVTSPQSAIDLLNDLIIANETCKTEGYYIADWVFTTFETSLNNAKTTLEQNNSAGCEIVIDGFLGTLEAYKTSGYVTDIGYNLLKTKSDLLIEKLNE